MTDDKATRKAPRAIANTPSRGGKRKKPEWADGLRQLYDSVVSEPLPDSFADLIAKLDESDK